MRSLRDHLTLRVLALVLAPLLLVAGFALLDGLLERREAARAAEASALRLAEAVSANQEQLLEESRQLLATMARDPRLRPRNATACNLYLSQMQQRWPRYANLGVARLDGSIACSAIPSPPDVNVSDRMYFRQAVATRDFAVGEHQIGRISGRPSVNFGYPLLDERGKVTAIVFAALDLDWLTTLADEAELAPGTALTIVDRQGTILMRYPDPARWTGRSARKEPVIEAMLAGERGTVEQRGLDGRVRYYGFVPLSRSPQASPVYVSAGILKSRALADANRSLRRNLAALALVGLLAGATGWFGGSVFVTRPVRRRQAALRAQAEAIALAGERLDADATNGALPRTVLTSLADAADADVGVFYSSHDDGLALAAARGLDPLRLPARLASGEGRAGRALAERRPIVAAEGESRHRLVTLGGDTAIRHELYVPLLANGHALGVVALGRASRAPFTADEVHLVASLGRRAAAALARQATHADP